MFAKLRKWLGGSQPGAPRPSRPLPPPAPEPEEIVVPEVTVAELQQLLAEPATPPLLLDVREAWEWRQVNIPSATHIPMNDVPAQLAALPREQAIVVLCAHGSRSYGVAGYLIEQGYQAHSLAGGITQWVQQGGAYARGDEQEQIE